jgi:glycosyltransferase involved in cell wall biosynthesis
LLRWWWEQAAVFVGSDISGGGGLAVVMRAFEGGGAQRDMVLLCNALVAKGVPLAILVLRDEGSLRLLLDASIRVIPVAGQRLRYAVPGLRRAIRALAPRLVVSSESGLNLCSLVAVRSLPRGIRPKLALREVGSPSIAQYRDPYRQNRVAYRFLRYLYRHADRIITLTDGARRDLARNFSVPERLISVMRSNAVIPPAMADRIARWDGESGREPDLIVCVGRLSPEKDHRTLLRAMTLMPPHRGWRLAIVGEGPERAALEAYARQLGLAQRVVFTGYVADPFAWMMRAGVAICSSVYEGLCNAIIEALACGTPVVSTDCPYGPREILQDGRYGTLTPVGDAAAMAAGIETALVQAADRRFLMTRSLNYTSESAATKFLEIVAELRLRPTGVAGPVVAASAP